MVVVMAAEAGESGNQRDRRAGGGAGGDVFVSRGVSRTIVGLVGDIDQLDTLNLRGMPGVSDVVRITAPYKLVKPEESPGPFGDPGRWCADRPGDAELSLSGGAWPRPAEQTLASAWMAKARWGLSRTGTRTSAAT